jgi:hypothetical protein
MAANLLSVTVKQYGSQVPLQDGTQNIWLLNKSRFLITEAYGANDTFVKYAERFDQQAVVPGVILNDTYSTIKTGIITNAYTAGKQSEFTVLAVNRASQPAQLKTLKVDNIAYVIANANDPTHSDILYIDPTTLTPTIITVNIDLAGVVTATTT